MLSRFFFSLIVFCLLIGCVCLAIACLVDWVSFIKLGDLFAVSAFLLARFGLQWVGLVLVAVPLVCQGSLTVSGLLDELKLAWLKRLSLYISITQ